MPKKLKTKLLNVNIKDVPKRLGLNAEQAETLIGILKKNYEEGWLPIITILKNESFRILAYTISKESLNKDGIFNREEMEKFAEQLPKEKLSQVVILTIPLDPKKNPSNIMNSIKKSDGRNIDEVISITFALPIHNG